METAVGGRPTMTSTIIPESGCRSQFARWNNRAMITGFWNN
jgi:hypothetical protein